MGGNAQAGGATVNNYSAYLELSNGNTTGTNNYGLYIIGNGGASASSNYAINSQSTASSLFKGSMLFQSGTTDLLNVDTTAQSVQIGSATTDTTQIDLQLDSFSTYADTGTCNATTNQGALYFNTNTASIRTCQDSSWSDVVTTKDLGLLMFGVVPDSGSTNPGDIAGIVTSTGSGPCRVYMGSATNKVAWTSCVAYSGGRRVVVAAGNATTSANTANNYSQLCLTGAGGQPSLTSVNASETANLPTWSATAPILCLATVQNNAGGTAIGSIFDTRTYTNTPKQIVNVVTTAPALGWMVKGTSTVGQYTPTTAAGDQVQGVVVASANTNTANTMNAIIATGGYVSVKSPMGTAGTVNQYVIASATTGKTGTSATANGTRYGNAGLAITSTSTTCTANNDNCRGSVLLNFMPD